MTSQGHKYFVTAIGTDSGKTLTSAILARFFNATYWKPIQCGRPTDSNWISTFFGNEIPVLPERYLLETPASPHHAANEEHQNIKISDFSLPDVGGNLIVEGAGGLMVPLNRKEVLADLISHLQIPVVLVINHYLGALNHSLLTLAELDRRKIPIAGLVFNGINFQDAESIILSRTDAKCWLKIPKLNIVERDLIEGLVNEVNINGI